MCSCDSFTDLKGMALHLHNYYRSINELQLLILDSNLEKDFAI